MKAKGKLLTKAEIAKVDDLGGEVVDVPEWGGEVRLAALSVSSANALATEVEGIDMRVRILAACMVGDEGAPLFSKEELGELAFKNHAVVDRLCKKAIEINKLKVSQDLTADIKNSASGPGEDSSSA